MSGQMAREAWMQKLIRNSTVITLKAPCIVLYFDLKYSFLLVALNLRCTFFFLLEILSFCTWPIIQHSSGMRPSLIISQVWTGFHFTFLPYSREPTLAEGEHNIYTYLNLDLNPNLQGKPSTVNVLNKQQNFCFLSLLICYILYILYLLNNSFYISGIHGLFYLAITPLAWILVFWDLPLLLLLNLPFQFYLTSIKHLQWSASCLSSNHELYLALHFSWCCYF